MNHLVEGKMIMDLEYININEFALRCMVDRRKVNLAIKADAIEVFKRGTGGGPKAGYKICWTTESKKFLKWCKEARLSPKDRWTRGTMNETKVNEFEDDEEDTSSPEEQIPDDMSEEQMIELLGKNISSIEADRIRKILKARRELLDYKKEQGLLVDITEFMPAFQKIGIIVKKSMKAIPPRVSTQYAAMTDHFKIKKHLEKEIDIALSSFDDFMKKVAKNA